MSTATSMPISSSKCVGLSRFDPTNPHFCILYSPKGRGIPDIAAQGNQYLYTLGLEVYEVSGTSASTAVCLSAPYALSQLTANLNVQTVAGIVSLLNDYRIATGRTPLGFLNPWLYSRSGLPGLTDIMSGSNPGCDTTGFTATSGWDPVRPPKLFLSLFG